MRARRSVGVPALTVHGQRRMLLERIWLAAHGAAWFPGWAFFQCAAIVAGGWLVTRAGRQHLLPYAVGVSAAIAGAIALGCGDAWLIHAVHAVRGARGAMPDVEIAGFGAIGGLVAGHVAVARIRRVPVAEALDALGLAMGGMIALTRLGCFFAGCDFGRPSRVAWAMRYPAMTPAFRAQVDAGLLHEGARWTLPVHPTQLYEVAVGLVVLGVALLLRAPKRAGDRFTVAAVVYAVGRLVVDVFRGDLPHGGVLGLTTTQGLALALAGLVVAWRASSPSRASPVTTAG